MKRLAVGYVVHYLREHQKDGACIQFFDWFYGRGSGYHLVNTPYGEPLGYLTFDQFLTLKRDFYLRLYKSDYGASFYKLTL